MVVRHPHRRPPHIQPIRHCSDPIRRQGLIVIGPRLYPMPGVLCLRHPSYTLAVLERTESPRGTFPRRFTFTRLLRTTPILTCAKNPGLRRGGGINSSRR